MQLFTWLKAHDLSNWAALLISPFISGLPAILAYVWRGRPVCRVEGLEVGKEPYVGTLTAGPIAEPSPAILFRFVNNTGRVVYLSPTFALWMVFGAEKIF